MGNEMIIEGDIYEKIDRYDKVYIESKDKILNLCTRELTANILTLGKQLYKMLNLNLSHRFFNHLHNFDMLADDIKYFDYKNGLRIEREINNWFKVNIKPFNDNELDLYDFAAISFRFYTISKIHDIVKNQLEMDIVNPELDKVDDKFKITSKKIQLYSILDDYIYDELSEDEKFKFSWNKSKVAYSKLTPRKLNEYLSKLINDMQKKYNLLQLTVTLKYNIEQKKNVIIIYHKSPLSAVFMNICEIICSLNYNDVRQCTECGYYMHSLNTKELRHKDCKLKHDRERKQKKARS